MTQTTTSEQLELPQRCRRHVHFELGILLPGNYTVIANFTGTKSCYGSYAKTSFYASIPEASPTATPQTNLATSDLVNKLVIYVVAGVIAIIVAIAIAGLLVLRKHS